MNLAQSKEVVKDATIIATCQYQKVAGEDWLPGLLLDEGSVLVGKNGEMPHTVWDYKVCNISLIDFNDLIKDYNKIIE